MIEEHEDEECQFKEVICHFRSCNKTFRFVEVVDHFQEEHDHARRDANPFNYSIQIDSEDKTEKVGIMLAFGATFLTEHIQAGNKMHFIMWISGTKTQAKKFTWTAKTENDRVKPRLEFSGPVLSYDENKREVMKKNMAFQCPNDLLSMYSYWHTDDFLGVDIQFEIHEKN